MAKQRARTPTPSVRETIRLVSQSVSGANTLAQASALGECCRCFQSPGEMSAGESPQNDRS